MHHWTLFFVQYNKDYMVFRVSVEAYSNYVVVEVIKSYSTNWAAKIMTACSTHKGLCLPEQAS
jgi:hypothetical protein